MLTPFSRLLGLLLQPLQQQPSRPPSTHPSAFSLIHPLLPRASQYGLSCAHSPLQEYKHGRLLKQSQLTLMEAAAVLGKPDKIRRINRTVRHHAKQVCWSWAVGQGWDASVRALHAWVHVGAHGCMCTLLVHIACAHCWPFALRHACICCTVSTCDPAPFAAC